jgi:hypothetical protein
MAYQGRNVDTISNVEKLDAITFDGSQSYTLQKGGSNFTPSGANNLLISIDGVVQAGNFTVSGSTVDFGVAVAGTSTNDFILHYGTGLITTPADDTVATAKLQANSVTSAKLNNDIISGATELATAPADTDEFLVSDAGTLKRIDYSHIKGTSDFVKVASTTLSSGTASVSLTGMDSTYKNFKILASDVTLASSENLYFRFIESSGDITGSAYFGIGAGGYNPYNSSDAALRFSNYNAAYGRVCNFDFSTNATNASAFEMYIPNPSNSATYPMAYGNVGNSGSNGTYMMSNTFAFQFTTAKVVTGIKFYTPSGGNINTGSFQLFGLKA